MNKSWYKRAIKDASNLNLSYNIDDMPTLVKQDSDFKFREIGSLSRQDSGGILANTGTESIAKLDDTDDYDWFRFQSTQNQPNLIPQISIAKQESILVPDTEQKIVDAIKDQKLNMAKEENGVDKKIKEFDRSSRSSVNDNSATKGSPYLRKRKPKKSFDMSDFRKSSADSQGLGSEGTSNEKRLLKIMLELFEGKDVKEEEIKPLTLDERQILASLMIRKFSVSTKASDPTQRMVIDINSQRGSSKPKRLEENYKLVFKKALKYLLSEFKFKNHLRVRKQQLEQMFYDHYFKEAFEKEGLDEEFYLSGTRDSNKKGQCLFNPKTINSKYVASIMKSQNFVKDFNEYLNNEFMQDYGKTRDYKIKKVLEKCYDFLGKKKNGAQKVKDYIENNPKCKLPWSDKELSTAKESVFQLLNHKIKNRSRKMSMASNRSNKSGG